MSLMFFVSYIALWILCLVQLVGLIALYHHFGQMYLNSREGRSNQGPDLGWQLQPTVLRDVRDQTISLPTRGIPTLIMFASTTCRECEKIRPALPELAADFAGELRIFLLCAGKPDQVADWGGDVADAVPVIADPGYKLTARLGVGMTPFVIGLDAAGKVCDKGLVNGRDGIRAACEELLAKISHTGREGVLGGLRS